MWTELTGFVVLITVSGIFCAVIHVLLKTERERQEIVRKLHEEEYIEHVYHTPKLTPEQISDLQNGKW